MLVRYTGINSVPGREGNKMGSLLQIKITHAGLTEPTQCGYGSCGKYYYFHFTSVYWWHGDGVGDGARGEEHEASKEHM